MAKVYYDTYGKEIKVGDLVMFPKQAISKSSRPDMMFSHVRGFNKGNITVFDQKYTWSDTYGTGIRASTTPVRIVSEAFRTAWESGDIFN